MFVFFDGDYVAHFDCVAGDGDALAVDGDKTVVDKLSSLATRNTDTHTEHNVVQSLFEKDKHVCARYALGAFGFFVVLVELLFLQSVDTLSLLFLSQLKTVFGNLLSAVGMHSGDLATLGKSAFFGVASVAFKEQFAFFTSALTAICTCISSHFDSPLTKLFCAWGDGNRCVRWGIRRG